MVWLTGGALVAAVGMIIALLVTVLVFGGQTFWPLPVERYDLGGSTFMGELTRNELYELDTSTLALMSDKERAEVEAAGGVASRRLLRIGNKELTGETFRWIEDSSIVEATRPEWATVVERLSWGRFFGTPSAFLIDGEELSRDPAEIWELYSRYHGEARDRFARIRDLEEDEVGRNNAREERARRRLRGAELDHGTESPEWNAENERFRETRKACALEFDRLQGEISALRQENSRYQVVLTTADGVEVRHTLAEIVRMYPANQLGLGAKLALYLSRWGEFLLAEPRDSNNEGGVFPAIVGTVAMTLIMSIMVVPFGVLAALYLREYARQGRIISAVRIAVNNLAGVPSIVFGVFGLGFFCYIVGIRIDEIFYATSLPNPTFGKGAIVWASLTLALLTLPVVIVATEEALSAVPNSMREGSFACGATKWQTIHRIILPRAAPGIMTGMILAIARGAGEVAPLMLVGAVKLAPELPVDLEWPFVHPARSFMHLGYHIYDLGFQSPDSEAAKPMVYTTTLLLIAIVVFLNLLAIWIRARLRRKFTGTHI